MSVISERRRASRLSDTVGTLLILIGVVGFLAAGMLTGWVIHDLDNLSGTLGTAGTISKLQAVALVGLTPGMISLVVIALGVHLQARSTELLFGAVVRPITDEDFDDDEEDEDEVDHNGHAGLERAP
jgi:hypothetical protein